MKRFLQREAAVRIFFHERLQQAFVDGHHTIDTGDVNLAVLELPVRTRLDAADGFGWPDLFRFIRKLRIVGEAQ